MIIRVLIIDDDKNNAEELVDIVDNYVSGISFYEVGFKVVQLFTNIYAFENSRKYLVEHAREIDLILCDFNLKRGRGTDLFEILPHSIQIYRILHSETAKSFLLAKDALLKRKVDDLCSSKEREKIHEALVKYETEILSVRLFGNPEFRQAYFINENRLSRLAFKPVYNNCKIFDILYILSEGDDRYTIYYRNAETGDISDFQKTKFPISQITNHLHFRKVNNQTIINLLWVVDINTISHTISFITFGNRLLELKYFHTETFHAQITPNLERVKHGIPRFFRE